MTRLCIGIFGQSFVAPLVDPSQAAHEIFRRELVGGGFIPKLVSHYSGGSSALRENAPSGYPDRYWWDLDARTPGPQLIAALEKINAAPEKPDLILWLQGPADANIVWADLFNRYRLATANILYRLRLASAGNNAVEAKAIHTFTDRIGRRKQGTFPAIQVIREAQLTLAAQNPLTFHHLCDTWDLEQLGDDPMGRFGLNIHLSDRGYCDMAWRAAQSVLAHLGRPAYPGPRVKGITRVDAGAFDLAFETTPSLTLERLAPLVGLAVRDGASIHEGTALAHSWQEDGRLRVEAPAPIPGGAHVLYPYGDMGTADPDHALRDSAGTVVNTFRVVVTG